MLLKRRGEIFENCKICKLVVKIQFKIKYKFGGRGTFGRAKMEKDVIKVDGEDKVVRADTASSYRGVYWVLASIAIFIAILAVLFVGGAFSRLFGGNHLESPGKIENTERR